MSSTINTEATLTEARPPYHVFEQDLGQGTEIAVEFPGEKPFWLDQAMARINKLLDLPANWDSYSARAVDVDSVKTALRILFWTMQPETPLPQIIPTSRGTIQLEWHLRGVDLEVEALPSGLLHISYEDGNSQFGGGPAARVAQTAGFARLRPEVLRANRANPAVCATLSSQIKNCWFEDGRSGEIVEDLTTSSLAVMTQALAKISERE